MNTAALDDDVQSTATPRPRGRPRRTPPPGDRLHISDEGDAIAPDGYCVELTEAFTTLLARRDDPHDRRKFLRRLREFTAFILVPGEPWDAFLHENDRQGEKRIHGYLKSIGCRLDDVNNRLDNTYDVSHDEIAYARVAMVACRQLYTMACSMRLHRLDSPADVRGWRIMTTAEKVGWAKARGYHPLYGMKHAGHRFFAQDTASSTRILYDSKAAASIVASAFQTCGAPQLVLDLRDVHRVNGLRPSDFVAANALGWARADFGDHFWCRNKQEGDELVKTAAMPSAVGSRVRARFEALPHPHDPERTLMDRIVELAPLTAGKGPEAEAASEELAGYKLFGRDGAARPYGYHGYRYWMRTATLEGDVAIPTSDGIWRPTSIVFRKAAIGGDVEELFATTRDPDAIAAGIERISAKYRQRTDQTRVYADWQYHLRSIRDRLEASALLDAKSAEERATSPVPIRLDRLRMPEARDALARLRTRPAA